MRYVKWSLMALVLLWLVFELIINFDDLNYGLSFRIGLPFYTLSVISMPVWAALLAAFTLAFLLAVALEVVAWYEYTRTIRLQRKQIRALQDKLEINMDKQDRQDKKKAITNSSRTSR